MINMGLIGELGEFRQIANQHFSERFGEQSAPTTKRILVDKSTHRIRFENETESQVTIVIEPKESDAT